MRTTTRTRTRWIRWGLLALAVGLGAWWWFGQPERMRLVATIPLGTGEVLQDRFGDPVFFGRPGLCLRVDAAKPGSLVPGTITLIGWDGQPRWTIATVVDFGVMFGVFARRPESASPEVVFLRRINIDGGAQTMSLSPDGRVFTQVRIAGNSWLVESWRDGRPLGRVRLPKPADVRNPAIQATNSGRIWVYDLQGSMLHAIDGIRVSSGRYVSSWCDGLSISPDGTHLLCADNGFLEYATLHVNGGRVTATRRYLHRKGDRDYLWLDDARALGMGGELVGLGGVIHSRQGWERKEYGWAQIVRTVQQRGGGEKMRTRIYRPAPAEPWVVPLQPYRQVHGCYTSADRNTVVFQEMGAKVPSRFSPLLRIQAISNFFSEWPRPRLALYTAPGKLRAVLPGAYGGTYALSPNGTRVAVLVTEGDRREIRLYAWGKD